jgi:hypothetical protein
MARGWPLTGWLVVWLWLVFLALLALSPLEVAASSSPNCRVLSPAARARARARALLVSDSAALIALLYSPRNIYSPRCSVRRSVLSASRLFVCCLALQLLPVSWWVASL